MTADHVEGFIVGADVALLYALWIFRAHVWTLFANWCLPPTLLDATWLTEGDPLMYGADPALRPEHGKLRTFLSLPCWCITHDPDDCQATRRRDP